MHFSGRGMSRNYQLLAALGILLGFVFTLAGRKSKEPPVSKQVSTSIAAQKIKGTFCPHGRNEFLLREWWKNTGDRPIRTLYMNVTVYNRDGKVIYQVNDYPIYSVTNQQPGVLPGESHTPGPDEGLILPFGVGTPDEPERVTAEITRTTEAGLK